MCYDLTSAQLLPFFFPCKTVFLLIPQSPNTTFPGLHSLPSAVTTHSLLRHMRELNRDVESTAETSIKRFHGDVESSASFTQDCYTLSDTNAGLYPFPYLLLYRTILSTVKNTDSIEERINSVIKQFETWFFKQQPHY